MHHVYGAHLDAHAVHQMAALSCSSNTTATWALEEDAQGRPLLRRNSYALVVLAEHCWTPDCRSTDHVCHTSTSCAIRNWPQRLADVVIPSAGLFCDSAACWQQLHRQACSQKLIFAGSVLVQPARLHCSRLHTSCNAAPVATQASPPPASMHQRSTEPASRVCGAAGAAECAGMLPQAPAGAPECRRGASHPPRAGAPAGRAAA